MIAPPVDELLDAAVGSVFPAAQVVIADGEQVVYSRAVGDCDRDTVFDIASLTKPLSTVTLTMHLLERGRLRLDDEARAGVTVRHLLAHASGLPAWKLLAPVAGATDARAGIVEAARTEPLIARPGEVARYSDLGMILLGDLVERAAGRRLDALFSDKVARPLGVATSFHVEAARCAPTEGELRGVVHDENARAMGGVAGHAGLFSTARDVSAIAGALVAAWRGRASVVAPSTVRDFWTPSGVPGSTWCLGWDRPSAVGSSAGARWPRDGVGHLAFTGCSLWIDPPRGRWVVLLSNRVYPTRANERIKELRPRLHDAVLAWLD
jgi:CubicO group peptidase (beta-lactamase class C family)